MTEPHGTPDPGAADGNTGPGGAGTEILLTLPTASAAPADPDPAAPHPTNSTDFVMKTHVTGPIRAENPTLSVESVRPDPVQPDEADADGSRS